MVTDEMKALAAVTIINKTLTQSYFSICDVDQAANVLSRNQYCEEYEVLRALHCVDYAKMPRPLREKVPDLIRICLGIEEVPQVFAPLKLDLQMIVEPVKQKTWKSWLGLE